MKTNSLISPVEAKDFYLKLTNMVLVVICEEKESFGIIFNHLEITTQNISSFLLEAKKKLSKISICKIIGPEKLVKKVKSSFVGSDVTKFKDVVREGSFEVLFNPATGLLRASKSEIVETRPITRSIPKQNEERVEKKEINVLIVDDSKTIRNLLTKILSKEPGINVVATAEKPSEVEDLVKKHKPDIITLDIHMPEMTGVDLLKYIHPKYKIPTIMVTSISMEEGPLVLEALENGAFDYIQKPEMSEIAEVAPILIEKVKAGANYQEEESKLRACKSVGTFNTDSLIVIGSSTGGTNALKDILTKMPKEIPPTLIVQHIPAVFSKAFADRINTLCPFTVKEAEDGEIIEKNKVLIAEGGKQMKVVKDGAYLRVKLTDDAPVNRFKPSVDYLFDSVIPLCKKKHVVSVMLTGMGRDGAKGMLKLREAGAYTIGQDEESSVVYGMPKEAFNIGAVMVQEHKDDIASRMAEMSHPDSFNEKAS